MAKNDFKRFVRSHPELINYVNSGKMSWQKFYEMYDIYGENNSVWLKYQEAGDTSAGNDAKTPFTTVGDTSLKDLFNMVKKIDLESVRKGAEGLQKAIALVQDFGSFGGNSTKNYQARPLYKHLED